MRKYDAAQAQLTDLLIVRRYSLTLLKLVIASCYDRLAIALHDAAPAATTPSPAAAI